MQALFCGELSALTGAGERLVVLHGRNVEKMAVRLLQTNPRTFRVADFICERLQQHAILLLLSVHIA